MSSAETDKLGEPFFPTMLDKRNVPSNQMKQINEMKFSHSRTRSVEESWRGGIQKERRFDSNNVAVESSAVLLIKGIVTVSDTSSVSGSSGVGGPRLWLPPKTR